MIIALSNLIEDKNLQNRLGKAGDQEAQQNYPIEKYVSRLDKLYQTLLGIYEKKHKINYSKNIGT